MEGQILGNRYLLLERIGGGGMAVVYKAKDTLLNRFVALKILRNEFANDEEFVKRFNIEAQSVASLSHPNVVSIYDVGYQDEIHYIVMELVNGMTLKEYINKHGALNWQDAVKITIQICSAIEHAHKNKIIHRDIKPHNILMTKEGIAKVTDFGIARAVTSTTITMVGSTIGSVHYFSPEQARGGFIDEKSDLYSLGIALYEMVTGKVPFDGDTPVAVALKQIQEVPIEPIKHVQSLPYGVNEIIMKAIQKEQNLRYQSATSMIIDLTRVLNQPQGGFIGQKMVGNESTIRMQAVNSSGIENRERANVTNNKQSEARNEKKKNNMTYWLAGITSLIIIAIALVITIGLLSNGEEDNVYRMENYVGKQYEEVKQELTAKGFTDITKVEKDSDEAQGIILKQSVQEGIEYKNGKFTPIEFEVSKGPQIAKVPDVINREKQDAQMKIKAESLVTKIEEEYNKDVAANYVIRTEPPAGQEVKVGTEVIIYVSKGPEVKKVKVPNLVGMNETEAQQELAKYKLALGKIIPPEITSGIVYRQLPNAYEELDEGGAVTIFLTAIDPAASTTPATNSQDQAATSTTPATPSTPSTPSTPATPATPGTEQEVIP